MRWKRYIDIISVSLLMNTETKIALKISNFIQQYQQTIEAIYQCRASTIKSTCSTGPSWHPLVIVTQCWLNVNDIDMHQPLIMTLTNSSINSSINRNLFHPNIHLFRPPSSKSLDTTRPIAQDLLESIWLDKGGYALTRDWLTELGHQPVPVSL